MPEDRAAEASAGIGAGYVGDVGDDVPSAEGALPGVGYEGHGASGSARMSGWSALERSLAWAM